MEVAVKTRKKPAKSHHEKLTERQIKRRVGDAWALLKDPVYEKGIVTSAELLYFDKDKEKVWAQIKNREYGHYAVFYYGTMDPNVVYLL